MHNMAEQGFGCAKRALRLPQAASKELRVPGLDLANRLQRRYLSTFEIQDTESVSGVWCLVSRVICPSNFAQRKSSPACAAFAPPTPGGEGGYCHHNQLLGN